MNNSKLEQVAHSMEDLVRDSQVLKVFTINSKEAPGDREDQVVLIHLEIYLKSLKECLEEELVEQEEVVAGKNPKQKEKILM